MRSIKTKKEYKIHCTRIDELLLVVDNNTPTDDIYFIELDLLSDLVVGYEEVHITT